VLRGRAFFCEEMEMAAPPVSKRPDPTIVKLREILALLGRGDLVTAEAQARRILESQPERADVNNILGIVLISAKNPGTATKYLEFAVKKEPQNAIYLNNLGCAYLDLGLIEFAHAPLSKALSINPKLTKTLWLLGEFYRFAGKPELALPYHEKACRNEPQSADYKWALGKTLEMMGRSDEARAIFLALSRHPEIGNHALYRLAVNDKHELSSPLLAEIESRLKGTLPRSALNALHNGAGKIRGQNGDYSGAFAHFEKANAATATSFDIARYRAWVDAVIATFTPDFFAARSGLGSKSDIPVFVVGMPRSGTTLAEQIIARHPEAAGAGELDRIWKIGRGMHYNDDVGKFVAALDAKPAAELVSLGGKYVNLLRFFAPEARRVVDKLPHNFEMLGLVALLFPQARIVHMRRNAADTCLSCYQNRLNELHGYSRDLETLGLYYREYSRLMDHWRRVLPVNFIDVDYEKLTADFESEARRLIAFLDLPWDPACLSFHESTSAVRTFSRNQIRNPIYQSSVGRWKHYEKQLQPLIRALGDLAEPVRI
jgi:tetratricopeptide (TPR) repeat protein